MSRWTVRSWIALGCLLIAFPVAMLVGEGLLSLLAQDADDPALGSILVAGGIGTLILVSPMIASLLLGRRARAEGDTRATAPMIVSGVLLLIVLAQTLLGLVGALVVQVNPSKSESVTFTGHDRLVVVAAYDA